MRLFIAIDIGHAEYFSSLQEQIKDSGVRMTFPRVFHVTLKFLGEVDEVGKNKIVDVLASIKIPSFRLRTAGIGVFPSFEAIRVVWVGFDPSPVLSKLQADIGAILKPLFPEEKHWVAHITLARVKEILPESKKVYAHKLASFCIQEQIFEVTCFKLIKSVLGSSGPVYEDVASFGLK